MGKNDPVIPLVHPVLDGNELRYLAECIQSGWVSSKGSFVKRFENAMAKECQVEHALALSSGTAALHLALLATGISPGDEVLLPALTYIADANTVVYCGAKPVFVDIDPYTWNLDLAQLEGKITGRTKAILAVHLYGHPVDMDVLSGIAEQHGLIVIEDACEAQGAEYKGHPVGTLGNAGCFSFYANKLVTTGEGGMLVTNSKELADKTRFLCNQAAFDDAYTHDAIGYNYRMSNLQAAVGLAQMERIKEFLQARKRMTEVYTALLEEIPGISLYSEPGWSKSVCWLFSILLDEEYGLTRNQLRSHLLKAGIESKPFFKPLPSLIPFFTDEPYPNSVRISERGISLPSAVDLTEAQIEYIAATIQQAPQQISNQRNRNG